ATRRFCCFSLSSGSILMGKSTIVVTPFSGLVIPNPALSCSRVTSLTAGPPGSCGATSSCRRELNATYHHVFCRNTCACSAANPGPSQAWFPTLSFYTLTMHFSGA
ncbi:unnamed protein product, partial [Ectocarpus sp. 12 AP-2014]